MVQIINFKNYYIIIIMTKFKITRTDIINYLIEKYNLKTYLEIGVRNPNDNFNKIKCDNKVAVDPEPLIQTENIYIGTSDNYFQNISHNKKFDIIFIDGLHLEEQVDKDITNSLNHLNKNGFILLHDCNPPTEFHQREVYEVDGKFPSWNGTVWRSIVKLRMNNTNLKINVIDTDWGVGVITKSKNENLFPKQDINYKLLENNREKLLNLIYYDKFKLLY